MVKIICNKCGKDFESGKFFRVTIKINGFGGVTDEVRADFCEICMAETIGQEDYDRLCKLREERIKRREDRKKERTVKKNERIT